MEQKSTFNTKMGQKSKFITKKLDKNPHLLQKMGQKSTFIT